MLKTENRKTDTIPIVIEVMMPMPSVDVDFFMWMDERGFFICTALLLVSCVYGIGISLFNQQLVLMLDKEKKSQDRERNKKKFYFAMYRE